MPLTLERTSHATKPRWAAAHRLSQCNRARPFCPDGDALYRVPLHGHRRGCPLRRGHEAHEVILHTHFWQVLGVLGSQDPSNGVDTSGPKAPGPLGVKIHRQRTSGCAGIDVDAMFQGSSRVPRPTSHRNGSEPTPPPRMGSQQRPRDSPGIGPASVRGAHIARASEKLPRAPARLGAPRSPAWGPESQSQTQAILRFSAVASPSSRRAFGAPC